MYFLEKKRVSNQAHKFFANLYNRQNRAVLPPVAGPVAVRGLQPRAIICANN